MLDSWNMGLDILFIRLLSIEKKLHHNFYFSLMAAINCDFYHEAVKI